MSEVKQIPEDKFKKVMESLGDNFGDEAQEEETVEEEVIDETSEEEEPEVEEIDESEDAKTEVEAEAEAETTEEDPEESAESEDDDYSLEAVVNEEPQEEQPQEQKEPTQGKYRFKNNLAASLNKFIEETDATPADIVRFAQSWSADYSGLDAKSLIRAKLLSDPDNAELSPKTFNRLYQRELDKYNLDSDDPDEVAEGQELLERDAKAIRRTLTSQAQDFVSKYKTDVEVDVNEPKQQGPTPEEIQAQREANVKNVSKEFGKYVKDGKFTLKDKDGEINIPVSKVDDLSEMIVDPSGFLSKVLVKDGKFDALLAVKVAAFASNPNLYDSTLIKHGLSKGKLSGLRKASNSKSLNPARPTKSSPGGSPNEDPEGFMEAMKKAMS